MRRGDVLGRVPVGQNYVHDLHHDGVGHTRGLNHGVDSCAEGRIHRDDVLGRVPVGQNYDRELHHDVVGQTLDLNHGVGSCAEGRIHRGDVLDRELEGHVHDHDHRHDWGRLALVGSRVRRHLRVVRDHAQPRLVVDQNYLGRGLRELHGVNQDQLNGDVHLQDAHGGDLHSGDVFLVSQILSAWNRLHPILQGLSPPVLSMRLQASSSLPLSCLPG